jgi:putative mRNA 3-end processing factor
VTVNSFIIHTKAGLYCQPGDFYLDPKRRVPCAVISHAHSDHAVPGSAEIFCTSATRSFMLERFTGRAHSEFNLVEFRKSFSIRNVKITFYPAGHMLGSAQVLMEYGGEKYLYTGDFKIQHDDSCEPFEFVPCDHLITETTFANPSYIHPDPKAAIDSILSENQNVVIGAYAIGKAQRITQLLTYHSPESEVYIHPDLVKYHRIYGDHGFGLGNWQEYRRMKFKSGTRGFYIIPPSHFTRYSRDKNVLKVFATGWKRSYYSCDRVLPVSDHADWNDLISLIKNTGAKRVYTVHGKGDELKNYYEGGDIEVKILC